MMRPGIFVTGTGTDVGKTVVSRALMEALTQGAKSVRYWKPVQTGTVLDEDVIASVCPGTAIAPSAFHFPLPASPDQAARHAGQAAPTVAALLKAWPAADPLVIEGAGGLLVPLNEANETWLDFLQQARLPVVLAATSGLGTLNHISLSLRELQREGVMVVAVVLSGEPHPDNEASLRRLFPSQRFLSLPHCPDFQGPAWQAVSQQLAQWVWDAIAPMPAKTNDHDTTALLAKDQRYVWHPYTQHHQAPAPLVIRKARGVWLETADGQRLLDGTSSWWVNTIGHGRPEIAHAIAAQQQDLDHVIFAKATHEAAVHLAEKVVARSGHLSRVFFTDNGSCAVEVAVKMAVQYWHNRGEHDRNLILTFQGGYHGDTFGAMSVGQSAAFHAAYRKLRFPTLVAAPVTAHPTPFCPEGSGARAAALANLAAIFAREKQRMAAVLIEPWLFGATGMQVQDTVWLKELAAMAHVHQVPLIFDEVFTGMGRLGSFYAYQRLGLEPDIVCLAKGLTGGNLPLALTLARESIFEGFLNADSSHALLHGHSYTANPIACRAALASLAIYEREDLVARAMALESRFQAWIQQHATSLGLQVPRALGAVLAFELPGTRLNDYFNPVAARFAKAALAEGLFLRPLGNTAYLVPPLVISPEETEQALAALARAVIRCEQT